MSHESTQHSPGQLLGAQRRKTWPRKAAASLRTAKFWRSKSPKHEQDASSTLSRFSSRIRKPSLPGDSQTTTDLPVENEQRAQEPATKKILTREISNDTVEVLMAVKSERLPSKQESSTQKQPFPNLESPAPPVRPSSFQVTYQGNGTGMFPPGRKTSTTSSDRANTTVSEGAGTHFAAEQQSVKQDALDESRISEMDHILELRSRIWKSRTEVHEIWADLKGKQSQAKHMVRSGTTYDDAYESCYLLQDKCEVLQNELTKQEKNLEECERKYERFYSQPGNFRRRVPSRETSRNSSSRSSFAHSDESSDSDDDDELDHPLVARLFSMQRDMDRRQDLLNDFMEDRKALLREQGYQIQQGGILDAKIQPQLSSYETQIDKLLEEMKALGEQLGLLRQDCLEKGLIDEYGDPV